MTAPTPRMMPIAAGLLSSAASRLPRVCAVSWRATPSRASSNARSKSSEASAWAPRRCASASVWRARAWLRCCQATTPAISASTSSDATPASPARRRRWAAPLARRPASRKARSRRLQLAVVLGRPVERCGQRRAAIQGAGLASVGVPDARGLAQMAVQAATGDVLVEPAAQPRPFAQERLVRDLDRAVGDGQQPALRELRDDGGVLLVERDPPPHDRAVLVLVAQAQEQRARGGLLAGRERDEGVLGQPRDGALDAAETRVRRERQPLPVAPAPELQQRRREQRQRPRLALDVGHQRVGQLRLDDQSRSPRRPLDRAPQLFAAHRPDEHVVVPERARELRVDRAAAVEVRAHGDHDPRELEQRGHELGPLALVRARREQLLELVDGEHAALVEAAAAQLAGRVARRAGSRSAASAGCRAALRPRARATGRRAGPRTCRSPTGRRARAAALRPGGRRAPRRGLRGRRRSRRRRRRSSPGPCTGRRPWTAPAAPRSAPASTADR